MMKFPKVTTALWTVISCAALLVVGYGAVACGTGGASSGSGMGKLTVSLSDPPTCSMATGGSFKSVYVTVADVEASTSATASASAGNSSGWVDLTPGLKPTQVDLLSTSVAGSGCFLAKLGDNLEVQAGHYQQIRVILAPNNSTMLANNACAGTSSVNCVVLSDGKKEALQLSSESKTGLKIPSGQIAGGEFDLAAGQTRDLNIDFNTCQSVLQEGNGQYRLKPVLHAGEVNTTSTSINGTVLDKSTGNPVNGKVMVALEQPDSKGVDRVVMSTMASSNGTFAFCPIPAGTYDVVVVGMNSSGQAYQPSIVTGVKNGETTGTIDLYASTGGSNGAVTLNGLTTSSTGTSAGAGNATQADVQLGLLEPASGSSGTVYTIPLLPTSTQQSVTAAVQTAASTSSLTCPTNTDCAKYSLMAPAGGLYVGAWSSSGPTLTAGAQYASYMVNGMATVPESGGMADCSPSELTTKAQTVTASTGATITLGSSDNLAFMGCTQYP